MQQASEQRPHKLSYHLDKAAVGDPEAYLQQLAAALAAAGLGVNLVYSGGRDVDLLALGADKGRALAFLLQQIPAGCQPPLGCQVRAPPSCSASLARVAQAVMLADVSGHASYPMPIVLWGQEQPSPA